MDELINECHDLEKWFQAYLESEKAKKKEQTDGRREKYRNVPKIVDASH